MKNVLMLLAFFSLVFLSCGDDDTPDTTDYEVTIKIINPDANTTFTPFTNFPIEVSFTRGADELIHHVKVELIDGNNDAKVLLEEHVHEAELYTFANDEGLTIGEAGTYTLRATSHDMDGNHAEPVEMTLTAQ